MTQDASPSRRAADLGSSGSDRPAASGPAPRRTLYSVAQSQHLLKVEFQRSQRYGYPLACVLVSIDQLGDVRDRGGYEAKERVLDALVALVSSCTRASDFLGRTADDRLLLLVPHTPSAGMKRLSERLLAAAHARSSLGASVGGTSGAANGRLTLSIGWAATDAGSFAFHDALLSRAEAAHADAVTRGGDRAEGPAS